jgi:hypothetical protein
MQKMESKHVAVLCLWLARLKEFFEGESKISKPFGNSSTGTQGYDLMLKL